MVGKEPDQAERAWCHHRRPKPPILTNQQQSAGLRRCPPGGPATGGYDDVRAKCGGEGRARAFRFGSYRACLVLLL